MSLRDTYETSFDEDDGKTLSTTICPECDGHLRTEGGETTCTECGLIVTEYWIDHASTIRSYDEDDQPTKRTGSPLTPTRHDRGLSTQIGYKYDGSGRRLSGRTRQKFRRLRHHQRQARYASKQQLNLAHACGEVARIVSALDLTWEVREQASMVYREAMNEDLIRGRSVDAMAAGSVYAVCRCARKGRTLEEVTLRAHVSEPKVRNAYQVINRELGLETALIRPQTLLPKLFSAVDVEFSPLCRRRATELAHLAEHEGIANGRRPSGVAAACLYRTAEEYDVKLTQAAVAEAAGTTATTLRERYYELCEVL